MLSAIHLRPLLLSDASSLAVVHRDAFAKSWTEDAFSRFLAQSTTYGLLAEKNHVAIGFVLTQLFADEAEILTFAIQSSYQGQGIGTQLLATLLEKLKNQNMKRLFLEVSVLNAPARALYEKHDFLPIAERINYFPDLANATALVLKRVF